MCIRDRCPACDHPSKHVKHTRTGECKLSKAQAQIAGVKSPNRVARKSTEAARQLEPPKPTQCPACDHPSKHVKHTRTGECKLSKAQAQIAGVKSPNRVARKSTEAARQLEPPKPTQCPACDHPCLLYTSPSPRDRTRSRMPSSA
eukprot:TRINITY_DN11026_c0_g1_i1.p1 TRINITY_DN11026_c0_g1~~TRINITY_DN11026_c0_g1_i1.p1  ORF type:complete len:145 (-),score=34.31 TRINITY_DN11026_c0_g1_i1:27-461(-)